MLANRSVRQRSNSPIGLWLLLLTLFIIPLWLGSAPSHVAIADQSNASAILLDVPEKGLESQSRAQSEVLNASDGTSDTSKESRARPDEGLPAAVPVRYDGSKASDASKASDGSKASDASSASSATRQGSDVYCVFLPLLTGGSGTSTRRGSSVASREAVSARRRAAESGSGCPKSGTLTLDPIGEQTVLLGSSLTLALSANGSASQTFAFGVSPLPLPDNASFNAMSGVFTFSPAPEQTGTFELTFSVIDGSQSDSETVTISVPEADPSGETALRGRILDANDVTEGIMTPLVGATVTHIESGMSTTTDSDGYFTLSGLPAGASHFEYDARTVVPAGTYGAYRGEKELVANVTNVISRPIYIMRIDKAGEVDLDPNSTTVVNNPNINTTVTIPPHTVMDENGNEYDGMISISPVPAAFTPGSLPDTLVPDQVITVQPMGLTFETPAPVTFPNTSGLSPGSEVDIWSMDHSTSEFFVAGIGRVTADGTMIETIEGGIREASWHLPMSPAPDTDNPPDKDGDNKNPPQCKISSTISPHNGCLETSVSLPSYLSQGESRALQFAYQSDRAYPQPIIPFQATISRRAAVPDRISYGLFSAGGVSNDGKLSLATGNFNEDRDESFRGSLAFDAKNVSTGAYNYSFGLTSHYGESEVSSNISGRTLVVNEQNSPFGAGWGLAGLQRLHVQSDANMLLTNGDGSALLFEPSFIALLDDNFDSENNGAGSFNYSDLANWDITDGTVDLIGNGFEDFFPGNGLYLDLDGTNRNASRVESKTTFTLNPNEYELRFDLAGSQRTIGDPENEVTVSLGSLLNETFSRETTDPFETIIRRISVDTATETKLIFDHVGGDNVGLLLDNVLLGIRDSSGNYQSPEGDFSTLTRNDNGTFTRRMKDGTAYRFNADGYQTAMVDRNGNTTTYAYDANGRLTSMTDPAGLVTTLTYSGDRLSHVTDPTGRETTFQHDANGNLVRVTLPDGEQQAFGYDSRHLMTSETDRRGFTTTRTYDQWGRLASANLPDGTVRQATYSQSVGLIDPNSGVGTEDNPAEVVRPEDAVSTITDGEGRTTTYNIGPLGRFAGITDAAGFTTSVDRDDDGNPLQTTRPSGAIFRQTYDGQANQLTFTDETVNGTTSYSYENTFNQVTSITDPFDQVTNIDYDNQGNPTQISTPLGRTVSFDYDSRGLLTNLTDPLVTSSAFSYDSQGNLTQVVQGAGANQREATLTYTPAGYVERITDPLGRTFNFSYDALGRLTSQSLPANRTIAYQYDADSNLSALTPPGKPAHTFDYNELGLMTAYIPPTVDGSGSTRTTYQYNNAQEVTQITRPDGQELTYTYDDAGRLTTLTMPRGTVSYGYDTNTGQLVTTGTPDSINLTYGYDGELLTDVTWSGPIAGNVSRTYDANYRTTSLSVAGAGSVNGNAISYQYDADDALTQAGDLTLDYNATTGLLNGTDLGQINDSYNYNQFAELASYSANLSDNNLYQTTYTRDKLGRITELSESIDGTTATYTYTYDSAGRLAQVERNGTSIATYTYDANGNRLTYTNAGGTTNGTYDEQDRLLTYGTNAYAYTANGELTTKTNGGQSTTYDYDVLGNLMAVTLPDGTQIEYLVDGEDRRIGKKTGGTLVQGWLYQDSLNPVAELDGNGNIVSRFVYGSMSNVPDYMTKNGTTYRIISDHLGSVRLVVNTQTGEIVQRMDYDAFGNVTQDTNPGFQPFGFAGGLYDTDTGLVRFGARDYDAETGRWTAKDPVIFWNGVTNLYTYVNNDPINLVDSDGAFAVCVSFYFIFGGTVCYKEDDCGSSISGSVGVGIGAGVSVDPLASTDPTGAQGNFNISVDTSIASFGASMDVDRSGVTGKISASIGKGPLSAGASGGFKASKGSNGKRNIKAAGNVGVGVGTNFNIGLNASGSVGYGYNFGK